MNHNKHHLNGNNRHFRRVCSAPCNCISTVCKKCDKGLVASYNFEGPVLLDTKELLGNKAKYERLFAKSFFGNRHSKLQQENFFLSKVHIMNELLGGRKL